MPIEIKELVIRTRLGEPDGGPASHVGSDGHAPAVQAASLPDTEALVQECVRQVLQVLARQRER